MNRLMNNLTNAAATAQVAAQSGDTEAALLALTNVGRAARLAKRQLRERADADDTALPSDLQ